MDLEEVVRERVFNSILLAIKLLKEHEDIDSIAEKIPLSKEKIQLLSDKLGNN
jgi:hypothetical protein